MARQSNTDLLARYRKQLDTSREWRRHEGYDDLWRRLIDIYRGHHYEYASEEDRLLVNVAFATVNVIGPSVAVNYPKITVNARKDEGAAQAIIAEAIVNYWWKRYKVRPQFRRAVKDFLIVGHGWMKQGYRYVEEQQAGTDTQDDDINTGDGDDDPTNDATEGAGTGTSTTIVVEDRPFSERVSPFDMFIDPDCTSMDDARWICQRIKRPLAEVKADKRYSARARSQMSATAYGEGSREYSEKEIVDSEQGYVEVYEWYDIARGTMSVFCSGGDLFLVKPFKMPYSFGHPFVLIRNYDVPDQFYPMGDLEAIEPLQRELNETRSQMMNHRKRYARKYLYRAEAFTQQSRLDLESDEDNTMVAVETDLPFDKIIAPMPTVPTPPEFYQQSDLISADIAFVSAISEYQRGSLPEIRRTATEAAIVQDAANARAADKLAQIEAAIAEIGTSLIQLGQQYLTGEHVVRVVGQDGAKAWLTFDKEYIAGEFDYDVEAGSTAPVNESFRRQSGLQLMDAMAPLIGAGYVNPSAVARYVLQYSFGIKNPDQFLQTPPPPAMPGQEAPGAVPPGGDPAQAGAAAPPQSPALLSGVDPSVLAQLSSLNGLSTPNVQPA